VGVRDELPSGTVTFLFTDVEGSTRLLHELGAASYAEALAEHRRLLRTAFARHGGVEVDTQADAFFVAFPTAPSALSAAREATEALGSGPIRVRIGLHTGTPIVTDEGYVGADVHRAARKAARCSSWRVASLKYCVTSICSAGRRGRVVVVPPAAPGVRPARPLSPKKSEKNS
jgi:class 3 adenylate cyclase